MKNYIIIALCTSIFIEGSFSQSTSNATTPESKNTRFFVDLPSRSSSRLSSPPPLIYTGEKRDYKRLPIFESIAPSKVTTPKNYPCFIPSDILEELEYNRKLRLTVPLNSNNEHTITQDPNLIILNGKRYFINQNTLNTIYEIKKKTVIPLKAMIHYTQDKIRKRDNLPHVSEWIGLSHFDSDTHFKTVHDPSKVNEAIIAQMSYKLKPRSYEESTPDVLQKQDQKYETLLRQMNIITLLE